ncbi:MAG: hypothetical protein PHU23_00125 [Dehalococcoidales bacterium]|nr:hypothetical protein [Dehalococcoidales bacterium]
MNNFKPIAKGAGVGLVAGVVDNVAQSYDEKRALDYAAANPGKSMSMWSQYGTYLNFLAPILGVAACAFMPRMSNENTLLISTVSGQLAGRKLAHRYWKVTGAPVSPAPYTQFNRIAPRPAPRTLDKEFAGAGIV